MQISGKKALVFGGTSGIGLATTHMLAKKGATVVAISRNPEKAGTPPQGVSFESCDVLDRDALQALFAKHAPFDILINCSTGGPRAVGPFLEMDMDGFQGSFAKLWGYTNVVRFGASHLSEKGAIVLVSGSPARKARPGQIAIGTVGAAVEQFAKTVARELGSKRINVVAPGVIDTPMFGGEGEARAKQFQNMTENNLIKRAGTPDEIALGIVFAIENDFITGTVIDVDGGIHAA